MAFLFIFFNEKNHYKYANVNLIKEAILKKCSLTVKMCPFEWKRHLNGAFACRYKAITDV